MMRKAKCEMCDTHEPNKANKHQWCDGCEADFDRVQASIAHQCVECVTPITCMMLKACALKADSIPNKLYKPK